MAKGDEKSDTAAMPTKEEFVTYNKISRQPKSISTIFSQIEIFSLKVRFSSIKISSACSPEGTT